MASYLDCSMAMLKKTLIFIVIFCSFINIYAQKKDYDYKDTNSFKATIDEATIVEKTNTQNNQIEKEEIYFSSWGDDVLADTAINFRNLFDAQDSINNWKLQKKYAWISNIDSALLEAQKKALGNEKDHTKEYNYSPSFLEKFFNSRFLEIFLWITAIGFVGFIIYHLFLSKGVFSKQSKVATISAFDEDVINHLDNDFDSLFKKAYSAGNTKLAMRYLFLNLLKRLDEKELIQFAAEKTNSIYIEEIPTGKRNDFAQIALYYEYIWYGNTNVSVQTFDTIKNKVNEFLNTI